MAKGVDTGNHPNRKVDWESVQTRISKRGAPPVVNEPRTSIAPEGHQHAGHTLVHIDEPPLRSWNTVTYKYPGGWETPRGSVGGGPSGPYRASSRGVRQRRPL